MTEDDAAKLAELVAERLKRPCPCDQLTEDQAKALGPMAEAYLEEIRIKQLRREAYEKLRALGPMFTGMALVVWAVLWMLFGAEDGTIKFLHGLRELFH